MDRSSANRCGFGIKVVLFGALITAIALCFAACASGNQTSQSTGAVTESEAAEIEVQSEAASDAEDDELGNDSDAETQPAYDAYLEKVKAYQVEYGEGKIINMSTIPNTRCMRGLCIVDLIDFDSDGDEELLLGYYDESQASSYGSSEFTDAQAYRAEVWGYENGQINKLYESGFHWTNGAFAYLPVYYRSDDVAMYTTEYSEDAENRSVSTNGIWVLMGDSFEEIATFSTSGMWGTGPIEYEIDGKNVDESTYNAHFDDVMGDCSKASYWVMWNDSSNYEQERWDTLNDPDATLRVTRDAINKLQGESAETSNVAEAWAQFPQSLVFASGAGAWSTQIDVGADGSFTGYYHSTDMGDAGEGYPNGTRLETHFEGRFIDPVRVGDYEYEMQLARLEVTDEPGEAVEGGVRVVRVTDSVYGLGEPTERPAGRFSLHLPGQPLSAFSDSAAVWLSVGNGSSAPSGFYAIVNSTDPSYDLAFRTYG